MKCLVCGKSFDGSGCPRCGFPVLSILGDYEEGIRQQQPVIRAFRTDFLAKVEVGAVAYRWKNNGGKIVCAGQESIPLGKGGQIWEKMQWIPRKFARNAGADSIQVRVYGTLRGKRTEKVVTLPNLPGAHLQQLGIEMNEEMAVRLKLRNESGVQVESEYIELFADDVTG